MRLLAAVVPLALLAGCSAPAATSEQAVNCEAPDEKLVEKLFGADFTVLDYAAVRSEDRPTFWYVAVKATDGDNDVVGVWTTNSLSLPALLGSVDGIAREFSTIPRDKDASAGDAAAKAAKACLA